MGQDEIILPMERKIAHEIIHLVEKHSATGGNAVVAMMLAIVSLGAVASRESSDPAAAMERKIDALVNTLRAMAQEVMKEEGVHS